MTLQGAIESQLPFLRAEAEARMVDTFDIKLETGRAEYNPTTKTTEPVYDALFTTAGYIPPSGSSVLAQASEVGARTALTARREIRIPWDSDEVPPNAVAVCVAVGDLTPPRMLGKTYRVGGSDSVSQSTCCHLEIVEELT